MTPKKIPKIYALFFLCLSKCNFTLQNWQYLQISRFIGQKICDIFAFKGKKICENFAFEVRKLGISSFLRLENMRSFPFSLSRVCDLFSFIFSLRTPPPGPRSCISLNPLPEDFSYPRAPTIDAPQIVKVNFGNF